MEGCEAASVVRGLCRRHYLRERRNGRLDATQMQPTRDPEVRFLSRVRFLPNGCWEWTGATHRRGYADFTVQCRVFKAHRWSYEHFVGPIPEGMTLDHDCHTNSDCDLGNACPHRRCVNPAHLKPMGRNANSLQSPNHLKYRTHCPQGHPYEGENLYFTRTGGRGCWICRRAHDKKKSLARSAASLKRRSHPPRPPR